MQSVKDIYGFGVTLFHVPDNHVAADELIESKHRQAPRSKYLMHPAYQRVLLLLSAGWI
ncbi:hypothetical protein SBA6_880024 [Candidatus Sulfopaludibacter sp. SbA6]|nr:hypothetical protein SBA6_880024 [Candidatus Sulfopaludibacter sp. SbA6]